MDSKQLNFIPIISGSQFSVMKTWDYFRNDLIEVKAKGKPLDISEDLFWDYSLSLSVIICLYGMSTKH